MNLKSITKNKELINTILETAVEVGVVMSSVIISYTLYPSFNSAIFGSIIGVILWRFLK